MVVAVLLLCAAVFWYGGRRLVAGEMPRWWSDALDARAPWMIALLLLPVFALLLLGVLVVWYWVAGS